MKQVIAAFTMHDMESLIYPERAEFRALGSKDKQKRKKKNGLLNNAIVGNTVGGKLVRGAALVGVAGLLANTRAGREIGRTMGVATGRAGQMGSSAINDLRRLGETTTMAGRHIMDTSRMGGDLMGEARAAGGVVRNQAGDLMNKYGAQSKALVGRTAERVMGSAKRGVSRKSGM